MNNSEWIRTWMWDALNWCIYGDDTDGISKVKPEYALNCINLIEKHV